MPTFSRSNSSATCDPRHLAELLGVDSVDIDKEEVIVHGEPTADAQAIIDSYVYDPGWNKSDDDKLLDAFVKNPTPSAAQTAAAVKALLRGRK